MTAKRVLMLNYADGKDHPRVSREANSLTKLGYQVVVLGASKQGNRPTRETVNKVEYVLFPVFQQLSLISILKMSWRLLWGNIGEMTLDAPNDSNKWRSMFTLIFVNLWALRFGIRQSFDVIHSHSYHFTLSANLLRWWHRAPLVHDLHESPHFTIGNTLTTRIIRGLQWYTMRHASMVITVGERLVQTLNANGVHKTTIIGNWRGENEYQAFRSEQNELRQTLDLEQYKLVIAFFGLFLEERAIDKLIEAVADSPEVMLLIGGRGELQEQVERYSQQYDNIRLLGWVSAEDVALYNQASDVIYCCIDKDLCYQSEYVLPNKVFESFAAGKAILATQDVGEMAVLLESIGSAHFIPDNQPETMVQAFKALMNQEYLHTLQENAYQARSLYTWELAEQRLKAIYDTL